MFGEYENGEVDVYDVYVQLIWIAILTFTSPTIFWLLAPYRNTHNAPRPFPHDAIGLVRLHLPQCSLTMFPRSVHYAELGSVCSGMPLWA